MGDGGIRKASSQQIHPPQPGSHSNGEKQQLYSRILFLSRVSFHETSLNASHFECGRCLELAQHHHESLCCLFLVFRSTFIPDGARGVFVVSCSCHPLTPLPVCLRVVCMRVRVCDLSVPHCCCHNIPQHLSIFRAFTHGRI